MTIVGSGIQAIRQFTSEAKQAIELADKVLYLVTDPISEMWIKDVNSNSESLMDSYVESKYRPDIYKEITERILKHLRQGLDVCVVFYGHPGVFVTPSHAAIKQARGEGFDAVMLPGISAEDCLFADLGIDPSTHGCLSFEATNFLLRRRKFDTTSHLILWQIGTIGYSTWEPSRDYKPNLSLLVDFLRKHYDSNHEVFIYEAVVYAICKPIIQRLPLSKLVEKGYITVGSTLYIPPSSPAAIDYSMANKLGFGQQLKPTNFHFSIKKLFHPSSNK